MWLAKVVAIFTHRTSLFHWFSPIGLFYLKTKIRHIFSFHSSYGVLIFISNMYVWIIYFVCIIKNDVNNIRYATEREISNKCYVRNHTILFVSLKEQLKNISFAVISLFILRENSLSEGEILDNKIFYKIIN